MTDKEMSESLIYAKARQARERVIRAFVEKLPKILDEKRLSQADLARLSGLEPWEISRYATGKQAISKHKLERIAIALGIYPDDIVPGYCSTAQENCMSFTSTLLPNGELWVEFAGAIPAEVHTDLMMLLSKANPVTKKRMDS